MTALIYYFFFLWICCSFFVLPYLDALMKGIVAIIGAVLGNVKEVLAIKVGNTLDTLLMVRSVFKLVPTIVTASFPQASPEQASDVLKPSFVDCFCFAFSDSSSAYSGAVFIALLARLLIVNENCFFQILQEAAKRTGTAEDFALDKFVGALGESVDYLSVTTKRKAIALAATRILVVSNPVVRQHWETLLNIIVDVLQEVQSEAIFVPGSVGR